MYRYKTISGMKITDSEIDEIKNLFDTSYGFWSHSDAPSPMLSGKAIKFPREKYIEYFRGTAEYDGECDVACCYDGELLVAEAVYANIHTIRGNVALVVQLVVHPDYRRKGIGSALLHSIWGFSDYFAWGIVTSNPCTVKTLEKVTARYCDVSEIIKNKHFLSREVLAKVRFLDESRNKWTINLSGDVKESRIRTGFATKRDGTTAALAEIDTRLGRIGPKDEWLAFIFKDQKIESNAALEEMLNESNLIVRDAYSRMSKNQKWKSKTEAEVDEILKLLNITKSDSICDFGAGDGRHIISLRQRGFSHVEGVDFASANTGKSVIEGDCRTWKGDKPYDLILCLYDVVGSFQSDNDNQQILTNIYRNLKSGGKAVISVMNIEFSGLQKAKKVGDSPDDLFAALRKLKPSGNMGTTGEVFDGSLALINRDRGIVYRKEQFDGDDCRLRRELVVLDMRFSLASIVKMCENASFKVDMTRYVRAGFAKPPLMKRIRPSRWGKEILLLLSKPSEFEAC